MKHLFALALLATLPVSAVATAADAPGFSGTWKLDTSKGANLGMMSALQQTIVITQTAAALVLQEASDFQGQKSAREVRYDLSGKPVSNPASMGGEAETVAKWADGRLIVTWTSEGAVAGSKTIRTETRSLSADTRTMTVESVRGSGKPVVMVYEKVE